MNTSILITLFTVFTFKKNSSRYMFTLQGASKLPKPNNELKYRDCSIFTRMSSVEIRLNQQSDINTPASKVRHSGDV